MQRGRARRTRLAHRVGGAHVGGDRAGLGRTIHLDQRHPARGDPVDQSRADDGRSGRNHTQAGQIRTRPARVFHHRHQLGRHQHGERDALARSMASNTAPASNFACSVTDAPACSAGSVWMFRPPTWNSGKVVKMRSALVRSCMCALLTAFHSSARCVSTAPFAGLARGARRVTDQQRRGLIARVRYASRRGDRLPLDPARRRHGSQRQAAHAPQLSGARRQRIDEGLLHAQQLWACLRQRARQLRGSAPPVQAGPAAHPVWRRRTASRASRDC